MFLLQFSVVLEESAASLLQAGSQVKLLSVAGSGMKLALDSDCFLCLFMWRGQSAGHKNSAAGLALGSLALILIEMIPASVVSRLVFGL